MMRCSVGVECSRSVAAEVKEDIWGDKEAAGHEKALAGFNVECDTRAIDIVSSGALSRGGEKHLPLFQPVSAEGEAQLW